MTKEDSEKERERGGGGGGSVEKYNFETSILIKWMFR